MHILAIDTSNLPMSIAVVKEDKVLGELTTNVNKNHSLRLMPALEGLLRDLELTPEQIDLFVVAQGPGSYTGVRIGVMTAKTMAWALKKPLVGISSLQILAQQVPYYPGLLVPLFDARRGQVYTGVYQWQAGKLVEIIEEQIVPFQDLLQSLKEKNCPTLFLGDDVERYRPLIEESYQGKVDFLGPGHHLPRASYLARLGYIKYMTGYEEELTFVPQYLQRTEAETKYMSETEGKV